MILPPQRAWDNSIPLKAAAAWDAASPAERESAVSEAVGMIGKMFIFRGVPADPAQSAPWPRIDAKRDDGSAILGAPPEMRQATEFLAGVLLAKLKLDITVLAQLYGTLAPVCLELPET